MPTTIRNAPMGEQRRCAKVRVLYTELIAGAGTQAVNLITLPDNAVVEFAWIDNVEAMTDAGSISACSIQVGLTGGDTDALIPAYDLFGDTGRVHVQGAHISGDGLTVTALFSATGANLGNGSATGLDTGIVDVTVIYTVVD